MSTQLIWILEDESEIVEIYTRVLGLRYSLEIFGAVQDLDKKLQSNPERMPDLVIADLRVPRESFLDYLSKTKGAALRDIPFIVVSASDDLDALRICYEFGALDFIQKPFTSNELVVKIERGLRKEQPRDHVGSAMPHIGVPTKVLPHAIAVDLKTSLSLNVTSLTVTNSSGTSEALTSKEFKIVAILREAAGHPIQREVLINKIWGDVHVTRKALDVHLSNLRRKIQPMGLAVSFIPNLGYYLTPDAKAVSEA